MTLQVPDEEQANLLKLNMPQVRSRLLMLLSSKDTAEILTSEGKKYRRGGDGSSQGDRASGTAGRRFERRRSSRRSGR